MLWLTNLVAHNPQVDAEESGCGYQTEHNCVHDEFGQAVRAGDIVKLSPHWDSVLLRHQSPSSSILPQVGKYDVCRILLVPRQDEDHRQGYVKR